jgi:Fe2+ or Zn2+ uptake regulation protein
MNLKLTKSERMILLLLKHQQTMTLAELQFATATSSRNYIYRSLQTMLFAGLLTAVDNPDRSLIKYSLGPANPVVVCAEHPVAG